MCGIAGILSPGEPARVETVERMVAAMVHRGPDGIHIWCEAEVALGMRRLAIVDIAGGAQPLRNEKGSVHVVFNGEIYNHEDLRANLTARGHVLQSRTDGAVIPHLYEEIGPALFGRLDGIFAVALWDSESRVLLLARDKLGVKPLYLHRNGNGVRFASEIKALLKDPAVPRRLDLQALDQHLTYRFTPAPRTLLEGVEKLEPATVLSWRDGIIDINTYWRSELVQSDLSFADAACQFRSHLRGAVHRQMMSDRPIGVMLSGGIDSGAIVALMAERTAEIKTFTVGFEGSGRADETGLAKTTAALFGTEHHDLIVGQTDFAAELPSAIETLEEPVATSSALAVREIAKLAREHVPVLLSGQGADELLAGYWRYIGEWLAGMALYLPKPARGRLPSVARASRYVRSARLERGLRALGYEDVLQRFMEIYAVFTEPQKREFYTPDLIASLDKNRINRRATQMERLRNDRLERDSLDQMMYIDLRLSLTDDLLLIADKMSMAESVELRVPFLDPTLVEFVESLPSNYKLRLGRRKALEKAALRPLLPLAVIYRRKRGFTMPIAHWLRTSMHSFAYEVLLAQNARIAPLFHRRAIEDLLRRHHAGAFDYTRQIFCLLSLELWAQRFLEPIGAGKPAGRLAGKSTELHSC